MKERKNRNRRKYKFTDKSQSVGGIFSTILAGLAVAFFCMAVWISYDKDGNAGREIGFMGLMSGMFNLTASGITAAIVSSFFLSLIFKPKD